MARGGDLDLEHLEETVLLDSTKRNNPAAPGKIKVCGTQVKGRKNDPLCEIICATAEHRL